MTDRCGRQLRGLAVDPSLRGHGPPKGQQPTRNPDVDARRVLARATSEDELLATITEALTLYGWRWTHSRRSDKALTMGHPGVPDIIAVRGGRVKFIELKTEKGELTTEQWAWLREAEPKGHMVCWHVYRPSDIDLALRELR